MTKSQDTLNKAKAAAVVITAVSALLLGVLNWFKEEGKSKVALEQTKAGYAELVKQVEGTSKDIQHLAASVKQLQDEVSTLQKWVLFEHGKQAEPARNTVAIIRRSVQVQKPVPMPAARKPAPWDKLQRAE